MRFLQKLFGIRGNQPSPDSLDTHRQKGEEAFGKGQYHEAAAHFLEIVKATRVTPNDYCNLAAAMEYDGRTEDAERYYRNALAMDARCSRAHMGLGGVYDTREEYGAAIAEYRAAIETTPKDDLDMLAALHANLGWALHNARKHAEAEEELQQSLLLSDKEPEPHLLLAIVYDDQGKTEHAAAQYQEVLRINPNHAGANFLMAGVWRQRARQVTGEQQCQMERHAVEYLQRVLHLQPDRVDAHIELADTYDAIGECALAHRYRRQAEVLRK